MPTKGRARRKFGTVLSVNSPPVRPPGSSTKKVRARTLRQRQQQPSVSNNNDNVETYTVVFPPGPMGMELEPCSNNLLSHCRVQRILTTSSSVAATVQTGDFILSIDGRKPTSYPLTIKTLKQHANEAREIMFQRCNALRGDPTKKQQLETPPSQSAPVPGTAARKTPAPPLLLSPYPGSEIVPTNAGSKKKVNEKENMAIDVQMAQSSTSYTVSSTADSSLESSGGSSSSSFQSSSNPHDGLLLTDMGVAPPPLFSPIPTPPVSITSRRRLLERLDHVAEDGDQGEWANAPSKESPPDPLASATTFISVDADKELHETKEQLAVVQKENVILGDTNNKNEATLTDLEGRFDTLQQERDTLEYQTWQMQEKARQTEQDRDTLSTQYVTLHESLQQVQKEKAAAAQDAKETLHVAEVEMKKLERDLGTTRQQLLTTQEELQKSKAQIEQYSSQQVSSHMDMHAKLEDVLNIKSILEKDIGNLQKLIKSLQADNTTMRQNEKTHLSDLEEIQEHHRSLEAKLTDSEQQRVELDSQLQLLRIQSEEKASTLEQVQSREARATKRLNDQTSRLDELRQELEGHQVELAKRTHQWREEKEALDQRLIVANKEMEAIQRNGSQSNAHLEELNAAKTTLEISLRDAKSQLRDLETEKATQSIEFKLFREDSQATIEKLQKDLAAKSTIVETLEGRVAILESQLATSRREVNEAREHMKTYMQTANASQSSMSEKITQAHEENNRLVGRLREMETELKQGAQNTLQAANRVAELEATTSLLNKQVDTLSKNRLEAMESASSTNAELKALVQTSQERIENLQKTLEMRELELVNMRAHMTKVTEERDGFQTALGIECSKRKASEEESARVVVERDDQIKRDSQALDAMRQYNLRLTSENAQLQDRVEHSESIEKALKDEIRCLVSQFENLRVEVKHAVDAKNSAEEEIARLTLDCAGKQTEVEKGSSQLNEMETEIASLVSEREQFQADAKEGASIQKLLGEQNFRLEKECDDLRQLVKQIESGHAVLLKENKLLVSQHHALHMAFKSEAAARESSENELARLTLENTEYQRISEQETGRHGVAEDEKARPAMDQDKIEVDTNSALETEKENTRLAAECEKLQQEVNKLSSDHKTLSEGHVLLKSENDQLHSAYELSVALQKTTIAERDEHSLKAQSLASSRKSMEDQISNLIVHLETGTVECHAPETANTTVALETDGLRIEANTTQEKSQQECRRLSTGCYNRPNEAKTLDSIEKDTGGPQMISDRLRSEQRLMDRLHAGVHHLVLVNRDLREEQSSTLSQVSVLEQTLLEKARIESSNSRSDGSPERELNRLRTEVVSLKLSNEAVMEDLYKSKKLNDQMKSKVSFLLGVLDKVEEKQCRCSGFAFESETTSAELARLSAAVERKSSELERVESLYLTAKKQSTDVGCRLNLVREESRKEKDSLVSEVISLQDELGSQRKRILDLEQLLRSLRRSASESESRERCLRDTLEAERNANRDTKARLESQLHGSKERISALRAEAERFRDAANEAKTDRDRLILDLGRACSDSDKQRASFETELSELRKSLTSENASLSAQLRDFRTTIMTKEEELSELNRVVAVLKAEQSSTARLMTEKEQQISLLSLQLDESSSLELAVKQLESQVDFLQTEIARKNDEFERKSRAFDRSAADVARLETFLNNSKKEAQQKLNDVSGKYRSQLSRLASARDSAVDDMQSVEMQLSLIKGQLQKSDSKVSLLQRERDTLLKEKTEALLQLNEAQDSIETMERSENRASLRLEAMNEDDHDCGASRSDLLKMCDKVKQDLHNATFKLESSEADVLRHANNVKHLEDDLQLATSELQQLTATNSLLESRLEAATCDRHGLENCISALTTRTEHSEHRVKLLQQQLTEQTSRCGFLTKANLEARSSIDRIALKSTGELQSVTRELSLLKEKLKLAQTDNVTLQSSLSDFKEESKVINERMGDRTAELELELRVAREQLVDFQNEMSSAHTKTSEESLLAEIERLSDKSKTLEEKISGLLSVIEEKENLVAEQVAHSKSVSQELADQLSSVREKEIQLDEISHQLQEVKRVNSALNEYIKDAKLQQEESTKEDAALRLQVQTLRSRSKALKEAALAEESQHFNKMSEMEERLKIVDDERNIAVDEVAALREQFRSVRSERDMATSNHKEALMIVDSLKQTNGSLQKDLTEQQALHDAVKKQCSELESESGLRQDEIGHLKANVQVLTASVSRLQSERALLEEARVRVEKNAAVETGLTSELKKMQTELDIQKSKMITFSEAFNAQGKALSVSKSRLSQAVQLIDSFLSQMQQKFEGFGEQLKHAERMTPGDISMHIKGIKHAILAASIELEAKRSELNSATSHNVAQPPFTTPVKGSPGSPQSPTVLDALFKVKRAITEDILSPKRSAAGTEDLPFDVDYMQRVIQALESQIDRLLADLQAANDALLEKDELFANLETLVVHHESQRDLLEQRLSETKTIVRDLEQRLETEMSKRVAGEEYSRDSVTASQDPETNNFEAAGKLLLTNLERREHSMKAAAFRAWSCQASAAQAVAQQSTAAAALSDQLDATREKLIALKRHMKKKGRSSQSLGSISESDACETE